MSVSGAAQQELLDVFRSHYYQYQTSVEDAIQNSSDTVVLWRLGDDLEQYSGLLREYGAIFEPVELELLQQNIAAMQNDIRQQYEDAVSQSHKGRPEIIYMVYTGAAGRPSIEIDPEFLRWAYSLRTTSSIAEFLGVSRSIVRRALIAHGIAVPREQPATLAPPLADDDTEEYPLINEDTVVSGISSYTGPLSTITDDELDGLLIRLRQHFRRAGVTMLQGMCNGYSSASQSNVGSIVFLALTSFGIMTDSMVLYAGGFLRASNNNRGQTVLDLFLEAVEQWGVPSRVRGDHGVENLLVAAWMEAYRGEGQGSYLWGRSVHNVRIERLWVDITAQVGATWADLFTLLEMHYGLDVNNIFHIWLLQHLFLNQINEQLAFFMGGWNHHTISMRRGSGPNRSPADMFGFDMLAHGVRGSATPETVLSEDEMEVYGVDWEALHDDNVLTSRQENNTNEGSTSWLGRHGPPENLNEITVDPPTGPFSPVEMDTLDAAVAQFAGAVGDENGAVLWTEGLVAARHKNADMNAAPSVSILRRVDGGKHVLLDGGADKERKPIESHGLPWAPTPPVSVKSTLME
ncbi:hypothetical protein MSAN_00844400 [Mycena sanguinolenta]|uniref:Integrase core domain-containing protein n=1 Tax=Mycena sanguinolenta TaxID=230812 RepID=A0A8H6YZ16_9AGAR|nr:hypothetical protein MSAN_00844400 [Mycena sanguinolenta]